MRSALTSRLHSSRVSYFFLPLDSHSYTGQKTIGTLNFHTSPENKLKKTLKQ